jgi:hypothetical protein
MSKSEKQSHVPTLTKPEPVQQTQSKETQTRVLSLMPLEARIAPRAL